MAVKRSFFSLNDTFLNNLRKGNGPIGDYRFVHKDNGKVNMIVQANPGKVLSKPGWDVLLRGAFSFGEKIKNHDFSFLFPENSKDKITTEQGFKTPYYRVNGQFNYYSDYLDGNITDERQMISFYLFYDNEENKEYKIYDSLPNVKQIKKSTFTHFEMNFSKKYNFKNNTELNFTSNIFFGSDYKLSKNFDKKDNFPLYNEIKFSFQESQSLLKSSLDKDNLLEQFICNTLYAPMTRQNKFVDSNNNTVPVRQTDLFSIVDNFRDHSADKIILTKKNIKSGLSSFNFLNKAVLTSSTIKAMTRYRRYEQILKNEYCDTEVIFFRVDKYTSSDLRVKVQSYYVPATSDTISILDTQIIHDKQYFYIVHAYVLVYGSSYHYSLEKSWESRGTYQAEISIDIQPDFKIYEIEMFRANSIIIETPLNKPNAFFVNTSNETSNISFRVEQPLMRLEQPFEVIDSSDESQKNQMKQSVANREKYKFQRSKIQTKYEVFRISKKPESYMDFEGNKIREIDTEPGSTSLLAKDHILPNKKYYYIFRALNITGKKSNPSDIYEVELKKESGVSKIHSEVIDISPPKFTKRSASFKQLMQIVPSVSQRYFDEDESEVLAASSYEDVFNDVYLGSEDSIPIWDRKFKFRVRSKSTGKIIDFNVKFKIKKIRNVEDLK